MVRKLCGIVQRPGRFALGCAAVLAFVAPFPGAAQEFKKNATSGFTFLEIPATARTAALGEASLALDDQQSSAVFSNPGALGFASSAHSFGVSYAGWLAETKNVASSYAVKTDIGVFAAGLVLLDYGTMPRTVVASGQRVYEVAGSFSASSMAAGLTYARPLTDHFSFGVTIKYAREAIDAYAAGNVLFDGGVLYHTGIGSLRIGAAIMNFGTNAKFINDEFKMPSSFKLGVAGEVLGDAASDLRVTMLAEALHPNDADEKVNVGSELAWRNTVMLRAGYKFFCDEESYTLGAGIAPSAAFPLGVDFAFARYGRLGNVVRFTILAGLI